MPVFRLLVLTFLMAGACVVNSHAFPKKGRDSLPKVDTSRMTVSLFAAGQQFCNGPDSVRLVAYVYNNLGSVRYRWFEDGTPIPGTTRTMIPRMGTAGVHTYSVEVTDSVSATYAKRVAESIRLTIRAAPFTASIEQIQPVDSCAATMLRATISNGVGRVNYFWERNNNYFDEYRLNNQPVYTVRAPGYYLVYATDSLCFSGSNTIYSGGPFISLTTPSDTVCRGAIPLTVLSSGNGLSRLTLTRNGQLIGSSTDSSLYMIDDPVTMGTYQYIADMLDATGCHRSDTLTVYLANLTASIMAATSTPVCGPVALTAVASGGQPPYRYNWFDNEERGAILLAQQAKTYSLEVTDKNGCRVQANDVTLRNNINGVVIYPSAYTSRCSGKPFFLSAQLTSPDVYTYTYDVQWSRNGVPIPGATTFILTDTLPAANSIIYQVTVSQYRTINNRPILVCTLTNEQVVRINSNPAIHFVDYPTDSLLCGPSAIRIQLDNQVPTKTYFAELTTANQLISQNYIPANGRLTFTADQDGLYTVTVRDEATCSTTIQAPRPLRIRLLDLPNSLPIVCKGTVFTATTGIRNDSPANYTFRWFRNDTLIAATQQFTDTAIANPIRGGYNYYKVVADDKKGCRLTDSTTLYARRLNAQVFSSYYDKADQVDCQGHTLLATVSGDIGGPTYFPFEIKWYRNDSLATSQTNDGYFRPFTPDRLGSYAFTATDYLGCSAQSDSVIVDRVSPAYSLVSIPQTCRVPGKIVVINAPNHSRYLVSPSIYFDNTLTYDLAPDLPSSGIVINDAQSKPYNQEYNVRVFGPNGCYTGQQIIIPASTCNPCDYPADTPFVIRKKRK